jgi:hypothetical protein
MLPTLRTTMGLALAGLLCMAPMGMAAGTAIEKTPGTPSAQVQPPTMTLPSVPAGDRIRTYRRQGAITPHLLYLLLTKGVTLALPDVRGGRKREENGPTTAKLDLFCAL